MAKKDDFWKDGSDSGWFSSQDDEAEESLDEGLIPVEYERLVIHSYSCFDSALRSFDEELEEEQEKKKNKE